MADDRYRQERETGRSNGDGLVPLGLLRLCHNAPA
jgi:hypothetical protein